MYVGGKENKKGNRCEIGVYIQNKIINNKDMWEKD